MEMGSLYKKWSANLSLFTVAFIWGTTFVIVQNAIAVLPPLTFNAVRFLIAGLLLLAITSIYHKKSATMLRKAIIPGTILGFFLFIGYSLQTIGLVYTTPSKAGFITGLSVVMVPFIAFFILKTKPTFAAIIGATAAVIGLYLLTFKNTATLSIGDFYVLLCAFGFAFHIVFTSRYAQNQGVMALTTIQLLAVSFFCWIGAIFFENWHVVFQKKYLFDEEVMFGLLVTAFLGTAAAFFLQTYAQRYVKPSRVALILTMEPVFAAATSYIWLQERLSIVGVIGCFFIFIGMILAELPILQRTELFFKKQRDKSIQLK